MSGYELSLLIVGVFLLVALVALWLMHRVASGCAPSRDRCDRAVRESITSTRLTERALSHYTRTPNG